MAHALGPSHSEKPQLKHHIIINTSTIVKHEFHLERVIQHHAESANLLPLLSI